jgi:RNA polymerase sigma-70 factor (ECF subfamily)
MTNVDRVAAPLDFIVSDTPDEETNVVRRAQARDLQAFEWLYRLHVPRVYAICLRMTANVRRAEELTQKAFLTAWEKLPLFRGESAFSSWLHRVVVNTVLADLRAEHRRTERVFGTPDPAIFETPASSPPPAYGSIWSRPSPISAAGSRGVRAARCRRLAARGNRPRTRRPQARRAQLHRAKLCRRHSNELLRVHPGLDDCVGGNHATSARAIEHLRGCRTAARRSIARCRSSAEAAAGDFALTGL